MRKSFQLLLVAVTLVVQVAEAQPLRRIPRIGLLQRHYSPRFVHPFHQRLQELGYVGGENIIIEMRDAAGKRKRLPGLVADLFRLKVDIIVATSNLALRPAIKATKTIPIVFMIQSDPVKRGWVKSRAQPGGNATGVATLVRETMGKRVELIKQTIPSLSRLGVLTTPGYAMRRSWFRDMEMVANSLGIQLQVLEMKKRKDLPLLFETASKAGSGAFIVMPSGELGREREWIAKLAIKHRLPAISSSMRFVKVGGLISYGNYWRDLVRLTATYVHKILKGAKPANLPVQRPLNLKLAINLRTAKEIDVAIPSRVLTKADEVIK